MTAQQVEVKKDANIEQPQQTQQAKPEQKKEVLKQDPQPHQEEPQKEDINWKRFKDARQKEREAALKESEARIRAEKEAAALKEALAAAVSKPVLQQNDGYDVEESEEQKIERKVNAAIAKKEAEYERQREEKEAREMPQKIKRAFSDFDQVCSTENLDYLEYHHPELAKSLAQRPESFDKWADIYNAVKRYIPNPDATKDMKKAEKNLQKPQSLSNSGLAPSGNAGTSSAILTEKKRAENWDRMQRTLKGLS